MKRRMDALSPRRLLLIGGSVLAWAAALVVILIMVGSEQTEEQPVFGSLEGRFLSDVTMTLEGETLYYRENEITNYLLIGVDRSDLQGTNGHQSGGQADFLLVLSVDRMSRTVTPVMLDRDTMVEMQTYGVFGHPAGTRVMQLCLAQAYSGVDTPGSVNTVNTVEKLLCGVKIDHYVALDMTAVPLLNDAIGGVEVTLEDDFTVYDPAMVRGATLRLSGAQAEFFVRGRMTVADGTNASRMARQQQYLSGFLKRFREVLQEDEDALQALLKAAEGHMASDASENTILRDVNAYSGYAWQPLRTPEGEHSVDAYGFAEFRVDEDALRRMVADLWFHKQGGKR